MALGEWAMGPRDRGLYSLAAVALGQEEAPAADALEHVPLQNVSAPSIGYLAKQKQPPFRISNPTSDPLLVSPLPRILRIPYPRLLASLARGIQHPFSARLFLGLLLPFVEPRVVPGIIPRHQ